MNISQIKTPAFLIDLPKLKTNIRNMQARARKHHLQLRPHVKTHKTAEIARMQVAPEFTGITVSTLAEAAFFQKAGFEDIVYAFPITPSKLSEAAGLTAIAPKFSILLDHTEALKAVEAYAESNAARFAVWLKVDCGYHRAGVDPSKPQSIHLAQRLDDSKHIEFKGILTHAGHSYKCRTPAEVGMVADQERDEMNRFAELLKINNVSCKNVSVGSTPTAVHGQNWQGATEMRPGNYVFFDAFQADIGSCRLEDTAATVLTTIAGHYPQRNQLLIDAGALALSKDPGATQLDRITTFGAIANHPELKLVGVSQEHGIITSDQPLTFEKYAIGDRLRIIPNHSCLTAALFPVYHVIEKDMVVDQWVPMRGW